MSEIRQESDEISLGDIIGFIVRNWKMLVLIPLFAAACATGVSLLLPNQYTASVSLVVPPPLGAAGGASIAQSPAVMRLAAQRFQLQQRYGAENERAALLALGDRLKLSPTKEGLLQVNVTDGDAEVAAQIANFLAEQTRQQILDAHLTEQSKRLYALQGRLGVNQRELDKAAKDVARLIPNREAALDNISTQIVSSFASLEAQLAMSQAQTDSVALGNVQASILQIRAELEKANSQVYRLPPEQLTALRNLYFNRAMVRELQKQIQVAKVLERQDVQIVLPAAAPLEKSSPKRALIVVMSGLAGLMLAVLFALLKEQWPAWRRQIQPQAAS
nr:Wzz/FepE/Etk N-terminal domain-containing protein [Chromobacterium sp. ASV5]